MCGIWISIGFRPDPEHIDRVAHRGPDGRGWRVFETPAGALALGHRRLAIIDVSEAGLQPMQYHDTGLWLVFNGEIYNYVELRGELAAFGYEFRTHTDSEVLLAAYRQWGIECLNRLLGMFAFAIWDDRSGRLLLARDRFGIKPLFMFANQHGVAFASEIKQFIALDGFGARMNLARVHDYLASGITDHDEETMFAGVRHVRSGEFITLDLHKWRLGHPLPRRRWYRVPPPGTVHLTEAQAAERFRELLTDAVRLHLRSDVKVGSCLSGGLDSSSIVCLIDRQIKSEGSSEPLHTVSAIFEEKSANEKAFMEEVISAARVVPHWVSPRPQDALDEADRIMWFQDEPYGSTSIFAQYCVFRAARAEGIKVMLDGQGADEQLAGYHGSFIYYLNSLIRDRRWFWVAKTVWQRYRWHGIPLSQQALSAIGSRIAPGPRQWLLRRQPQPRHRAWLNSPAFASLGMSGSAFEDAVRRDGLPRVDSVGNLCVALTQTTNLPMLLRYEDRSSMAHSVEARVPFVDHRVVEFCIGLGDAHKIVGGETKRVLRCAMNGTLPDKITRRRDKLGFATPETEWFRGPMRPRIEEAVDEALRAYPDLFNVAEARALVRDMLDGIRPVDFSIWRLISMGVWRRVHGVAI